MARGMEEGMRNDALVKLCWFHHCLGLSLMDKVADLDGDGLGYCGLWHLSLPSWGGIDTVGSRAWTIAVNGWRCSLRRTPRGYMNRIDTRRNNASFHRSLAVET